jgi:hypothetical protein
MDMKDKINKEVELVLEELETVEYENKEAFIEDRVSSFVADWCYDIVPALSNRGLHDLKISKDRIGSYIDVSDLISDLAAKLMVKEVLKAENN